MYTYIMLDYMVEMNEFFLHERFFVFLDVVVKIWFILRAVVSE